MYDNLDNRYTQCMGKMLLPPLLAHHIDVEKKDHEGKTVEEEN